MDFNGLILLVLVGVALRYGVPWYLSNQRRQRLVASAIADVDRMDGKQFEQYLEALFRKLGHRVERTRYVGDYGADLVTVKGGVRTVIQAKRYQKAVGIKAVQEAVAAKGMYGCAEAMVVTNSTFTKAAVNLAQANKVVLWDRAKLVEALLTVNKVSPPAPVTAEAAPLPTGELTPAPQAACAACGAPVSAKVERFCRSQPQRFGGRVFCFAHQRTNDHCAA